MEKRPLDATAREPPRSTKLLRERVSIVFGMEFWGGGRIDQVRLPMLAIVPPWRIPRRFWGGKVIG